MQVEDEKLWEGFLTALHSSHNESASRHALLRSGMHSIAESLVACRFKPHSGGAGGALLALENSLRQVLQRLVARQASLAGPAPDRCLPLSLASKSWRGFVLCHAPAHMVPWSNSSAPYMSGCRTGVRCVHTPPCVTQARRIE